MMLGLLSSQLLRELPIHRVIVVGIILCATCSWLAARADSVLAIASAHGAQSLGATVMWNSCSRASMELFKDSYVLVLDVRVFKHVELCPLNDRR